ncbi:aspartate aminotransferase, partial [Thalassiosira pseudonana CCMP1335]
IYSLAQGVVHWRPPKQVYELLGRAIQSNLDVDAGADDGYPPLLSALKAKLQTENGLHNPHVMITAGANQAFVNCVLTLLDERDEMGNRSKCVVFEPYYFNHVMALDAKSVEGLLVGQTDKGVPDLKWLRNQLEQHQYSSGNNGIRMVTLVNPGNPTGVSLPYEFLEEMMQLTKEFRVWLVMDNTYEHFDVKRKNKLPEGTLPDFQCFDEMHVINIFSFSKGYAMAGMRVGYLALTTGRGTRAYEQMLKVQDTVVICNSRLSQMAALGALQAGRQWVYDQVDTLEIGREAILEAMSTLEETIGGDGAMYLMGKLPEGVDDQVCVVSSLVEHYGVAVIPGSFCGYPGWIRVCYSNLPPEECKVAASRLKEGLSEL